MSIVFTIVEYSYRVFVPLEFLYLLLTYLTDSTECFKFKQNENGSQHFLFQCYDNTPIVVRPAKKCSDVNGKFGTK